jgi:DNA-binding IclR family transcriptional regulator
MIGHLEGRPFTASKLAAYLDCPRTSVLRRLQALIDMGSIERRGSRYYVAEQRFNSARALEGHAKIVSVAQKHAAALNEPCAAPGLVKCLVSSKC